MEAWIRLFKYVFNSVLPCQGGNNFTAPEEVIVISTFKDNEFTPTVPLNNDKSRTPFGPSRPVSLRPARRGGRRGSLSSKELEERREARRQGACLRCRKTKEKVLRA